MDDKKPHWMLQHEADDKAQFAAINEKLDSIIDLVSFARMGWRGSMGLLGLLAVIGTVIYTFMRIFSFRA